MASETIELKREDLQLQRLVFGDDVRDLLWPAFFGNQTIRDLNPIHLALPNGQETALPLDFFGAGVWGTKGTPELWRWLTEQGREAGDSLLLEAIYA